MYISDFTENLLSIIKLFVDGTFIFSVAKYVILSTDQLNRDFENIYKWAYQWEMYFNPDFK